MKRPSKNQSEEFKLNQHFYETMKKIENIEMTLRKIRKLLQNRTSIL